MNTSTDEIVADGASIRVPMTMMDSMNIESLVAERVAVLARAQALHPTFDAGEKSLAEVRRAVVAKQFGDAAVDGRSDDYVRGLFDNVEVLKRPRATKIELTLVDNSAGQAGSEALYQAHRRALADAWRSPDQTLGLGDAADSQTAEQRANAAYAANKQALADGWRRA
jgi:hypothetical protein